MNESHKDTSYGQVHTSLAAREASNPNTPSSPSRNDPSPVAVDSQLAIILAKLNELDVIKTHLHTIDHRLDILQTPPNTLVPAVQRS